MQPLWKTVRRFPNKQKLELLYDPAVSLLGIYLDKTIIQKDACTLVFTAALFRLAKTWKQPTYPSTDEWIKKTGYKHTVEHYSAIKKNEMPLTVTWTDLKTVTLSKVSQTKTDIT